MSPRYRELCGTGVTLTFRVHSGDGGAPAPSPATEAGDIRRRCVRKVEAIAYRTSGHWPTFDRTRVCGVGSLLDNCAASILSVPVRSEERP